MMKKIVLLFILGLLSLGAQAKMKVFPIRQTSDLATSGSAEDILNIGHNNLSYHVDWSDNDDVKQALVIVRWDGFPAEDLNELYVEIEPYGIPKVEHKIQGRPETWIYLPQDTRSITLRHAKYGDADIQLEKMNYHDVWSVLVALDKLVNIEIKPLTDYNKSVRVVLVNNETHHEREAKTPAFFENVLPGEYDVRFAIDGRIKERSITVTPTRTVFGEEDFDFRNYKEITIESTLKGSIYIDNEIKGDDTSVTVQVPFGPHTVSVKVDDNLMDKKVIDVNAESPGTFYLTPVQLKTFEVVGLYKGKKVPIIISVPGLPKDCYREGVAEDKHQFTLPVNSKPYKYYVYYEGRKGSKEIHITPKMNNVQEINISADQKMVWPWQRDYKNQMLWCEISFVAKQYSTTTRLSEEVGNIKTTVRENGVWNDGYNKWLRGIRLGSSFQPAFKFGLGVYTGLFMEFYYSEAKERPIDIYDKYLEWDFSIPAHILYQVPLGREFCVGFHTGLSFNYAVSGAYFDKWFSTGEDTDNVEVWSNFWKMPWAPKRFNMDWDFCLFFRWKKVMISGTLSRGLTDNKMYEDFGLHSRTIMNKAIVAVSIGL